MSIKRWTRKEVDEILRANHLQAYIDEMDAIKLREERKKKESKKVFKSTVWEEKRDFVQTPGKIIGNIAFEQQNETNFIVYDLEADDFVITDKAEGFTSYETEKIIYVPFPRPLWRNLPMPEVSPFLVRDLYADVRRFIFNVVDFARDIEYDIASSWVLHTWRLENFNVTPYLFFYGPVSSGKTRAMEALSALSFRPFMGATSTAGLYNLTERYKPTIFLDETELYLRGEEKADILNYLNMGYRRGQYVVRMVENKKTGELEPKAFDPYGAKCLAGTRELLTTLKSRSFIYPMSRATRSLRRTIDMEEADNIRRKLITYRFKALAEHRERNTLLMPIPDDFLPDLQDGRLRELFHPLIETATDNVKELFLSYADRLQQETREAEALSGESLVFNALVNVRNERVIVPLDEITDAVNANLSFQDERWGNKHVSTVLNRLGFKRHLIKNKVHIIWDEQLGQRLSDRYPSRKIELDREPDKEALHDKI